MRKLYTDLGIASVEALEEAVRTESQAESMMFLNFSASAAFVNGLSTQPRDPAARREQSYPVCACGPLLPSRPLFHREGLLRKEYIYFASPAPPWLSPAFLKGASKPGGIKMPSQTRGMWSLLADTQQHRIGVPHQHQKHTYEAGDPSRRDRRL
jgi:hypothetical protein